MINIIKSDLYRIFKGKAIYVVILLTMFLSFISAFSMTAGHIGMADMTVPSKEEQKMTVETKDINDIMELRKFIKQNFEFELDKKVIGTNINLYYLFIIITVTVISTDFSTKAIKNTLSSAISRKKYYTSKVFLIFFLSTALIFFNNYFFYFLNLIMNGSKFSSSFIEILKTTLIQLPLLYGIISLLICFAFVFKKTATFNTVSIPFILLFQLIVMGTINLFRIQTDLFYKYEIQNALHHLVANPTNNYILNCTLLGIFYIIVFNIIGYCAFRNTEIK